MVIFRQLFDAASSTYSYLLGDDASREALLIDPVFEQARRDGALVGELGLRLSATLETHVHADHVTGAWLHKQRTKSQILVGAESGAEGADRLLAPGDRVSFGARFLTVRATPGHTRGCLTYVLDDESLAFTGDCQMIRACGRTDFQGGDAATLFRSVHEQIWSLPNHCLLYPAHDYRGLTATSVAEERRFNPRLGGGILEPDFVAYMGNLGLPHPKQMDLAVPANLRCGQPAAGQLPPDPTWAPLTFTFAGHWEIDWHALEEHRADVQVVDVREPEELAGELGRVPGAIEIPLGQLDARMGELDRQKPVVTLCRSGARSAQAALKLQKAGFDRPENQAAHLAGGLLATSQRAANLQTRR